MAHLNQYTEYTECIRDFLLQIINFFSSLGSFWLFADVMKKSKRYFVYTFECPCVVETELVLSFRYFIKDRVCDEITQILIFILK